MVSFVGKPETLQAALEMLPTSQRPQRTRLATLSDIHRFLTYHITLSRAIPADYEKIIPLNDRIGILTPALLYEMEQGHSFYRHANFIYRAKLATLSETSPWSPILTGRKDKPTVGWFEIYHMKPKLGDNHNSLISMRHHAFENKAGEPPNERLLTRSTWKYLLGIASNRELDQLTADLNRT